MTRKYRDFSIALMHGTNFPIMILVGVFLGYFIGKNHGAVTAGICALIGGMLGLAIATFQMFQWEKRAAKRRK